MKPEKKNEENVKAPEQNAGKRSRRKGKQNRRREDATQRSGVEMEVSIKWGEVGRQKGRRLQSQEPGEPAFVFYKWSLCHLSAVCKWV